jgi:hypothetical protein
MNRQRHISGNTRLLAELSYVSTCLGQAALHNAGSKPATATARLSRWLQACLGIKTTSKA